LILVADDLAEAAGIEGLGIVGGECFFFNLARRV
jgi:hypothetical protein